jgi:hypothetical protein
MFTQVSRMLLMLAALLGVMNPPGRPPGHKPPKPGSPGTAAPATAPCPHHNCTGRGIRQGNLDYKCNRCGKFSRYCTHCSSLYQDGEQGQHQHPQAV